MCSEWIVSFVSIYLNPCYVYTVYMHAKIYYIVNFKYHILLARPVEMMS